MTYRQEIQASMEAKLATGIAIIETLKSIMVEGGSEVSEHAKVTLASAESLLTSGRTRLDELAQAPDDQFEELVVQTQESWRNLACEIDGGWCRLTEKIQSYYS